MDGSEKTLELEYYLIHQNRYRFILKKISELNLPKGAKILDIGCFPLHLFLKLKELGFEVYGVSSQHERVDLENVESLNIETDKLPFKNNFFDLVLLTEVVEHLVVDPGVYLEKIKKVMKPDGLLFITTPNAAFLEKRIRAVLGLSTSFSLDELFNTKSSKQIYFRHNREFTLDELQKIMYRNEFSKVESGYFSSYSPFRKKLHPEPFLTKIVKIIGFLFIYLIPPFQDSIFLLASKKN